MPKALTIIGQVKDWRWLNACREISGQMYDDKKGLLVDGSNVVLKVKYKSDIICERPYWLIATHFTETHERYIMYFDTEYRGQHEVG